MLECLEEYFGKLLTDEIILMEEREQHIQEHHPNDFELFCTYGKETIQDPDMIINDSKNDGTIFMIKKLESTNLNVIVRVVLETDNPKYKNSIMTFYRVRDKNLMKLIKKAEIIYKKQ
ncbi:MAG: hypothetical protein H6Q70_2063 [Firmicutes bacterium]|nr:hypothetical protein [Bacillota bacterium]